MNKTPSIDRAVSEVVATYRAVAREYAPDPDVFSVDDPAVARVKLAVSRLDPADRAILIQYAELGSLHKLGAMLGVATSTIHSQVQRIRRIVVADIREQILRENGLC